MQRVAKVSAVNRSVQEEALQLETMLAAFDHVVVAFSGGVDSSVVAAAAHRANRVTAIAVTATSPSVPRWQIEVAKRVAAEIGIQHQIMPTREGELEPYRRNDARRCFHCKQTLYWTLAELAEQFQGRVLVSGTNSDDLGDYRPGIEAGRQAGVVTPLADLGLSKPGVRELARWYDLSNADLPASPCLASRIAYGTEVTPSRLRKIEQAEDWLRQKGFTELRVRLLAGDAARIEVAKDEIPRLMDLDDEGMVRRAILACGFQSVTIDPDGFRSGNMNRALVSLDQIRIETGVAPSHEAVDEEMLR